MSLHVWFILVSDLTASCGKVKGYLHFIENAQLSVIDLQINVHQFVQFTYGKSYR